LLEQMQVVQIFQFTDDFHTRIINDHINPAIRLPGEPDQRFAPRFIGYVSGYRYRFASTLLALHRQRIEALGIARSKSQPGSLIGQLKRQSPTNPARGACDDDHFLSESIFAHNPTPV
jgi:hypothetical protein